MFALLNAGYDCGFFSLAPALSAQSEFTSRKPHRCYTGTVGKMPEGETVPIPPAATGHRQLRSRGEDMEGDDYMAMYTMNPL